MSRPASLVVKTYPARGPMQQFRMDGILAFSCFRCGQDKKSKLITIYSGDWGRRLCNGCYGRLLSIFEVKASTSSDDERTEQLAALLLNLCNIDDARSALRLSEIAANGVDALKDRGRRFLGTSEYVAGQLRGQDTLEWSPAVIGLCKATEVEMVIRLLEPWRAGCQGRDLTTDLADKDLGRMARYCNSPSGPPPELGVIEHTLRTAANSRSRTRTSPLLAALNALLAKWPRSAWILANDGLTPSLSDLIQRFRNRAAHLDALDEADYLACRAATAGSNGILWQLLRATA